MTDILHHTGSFGMLDMFLLWGVISMISALLMYLLGAAKGGVFFWLSVSVSIGGIAAIAAMVTLALSEEERIESFHEHYPGLSAIYVAGSPVEDIDAYLVNENEEGADLGINTVSLAFDDGREYKEAFLVVEESDRKEVFRTVSLGERDESATDEDSLIHSTDQMTEIGGGSDTLTYQIENRAAALEVEAAESDEGFWDSSNGSVWKWVGGIGGAVVLSTLLIMLSGKIFTSRANTVRTKLENN